MNAIAIFTYTFSMLCRLCLIMMVRSRIRNYHITDFYKNVYVLVFHYFSWICSFHNYLLTCTLPGDGKDTNVQWVTVRILVSSGLWVMGEIFFFSPRSGCWRVDPFALVSLVYITFPRLNHSVADMLPFSQILCSSYMLGL